MTRNFRTFNIYAHLLCKENIKYNKNIKGGEKMSSYIIQGGNKLEGTVKISGSKNSSLPIIAATILNGGETTLYNVPNIHDTHLKFEIIKKIGGKVTTKKDG